jgi:hypothetical protein
MRALVCAACRCELERVGIAGGCADVICIAYRLTGNEQGPVAGARLAKLPQEPRRPERRAVTRRQAGSGRRSTIR